MTPVERMRVPPKLPREDDVAAAACCEEMMAAARCSGQEVTTSASLRGESVKASGGCALLKRVLSQGHLLQWAPFSMVPCAQHF
jgi:hypothetical protein